MMDRLFGDFQTTFHSAASDGKSLAPNPRAQLRDLGEAVSVLVDLPGVRLDQCPQCWRGDRIIFVQETLHWVTCHSRAEPFADHWFEKALT